LITTAATPPDLPAEELLGWFASKLWSIPLHLRHTVATPEIFRLFTEIFDLTPPPLLVDAVCSAMESALRPARENSDWGAAVETDETHKGYTRRVCTPALANTLCRLIAVGSEYASRALVRLLSYFVDSEEFKELSARDSGRLVRLCEPERHSAAFTTAQNIHARRLLAENATSLFPKSPLPLGEECL
jgi:hypothetical protein